MNAITSFVDASAVYGSNRFTARRLRTRKNGLMKVKERTEKSKGMPFNLKSLKKVFRDDLLPREGAGDFRFSAQPTLMAVHTVFMRWENSEKRNNTLD